MSNKERTRAGTRGLSELALLQIGRRSSEHPFNRSQHHDNWSESPAYRQAMFYLKPSETGPSSISRQLVLGDARSHELRFARDPKATETALRALSEAFFSAIHAHASWPASPAINDEVRRLREEVAVLKNQVTWLTGQIVQFMPVSAPAAWQASGAESGTNALLCGVAEYSEKLAECFVASFGGEVPNISVESVHENSDYAITVVFDASASNPEIINQARATGGRSRFYTAVADILPSAILDQVQFEFRFPK